MDSFLEVKHLSFSYYKSPLCIKDVSFSAGKNEKVLVLGVEGSGKTALLETIAGFETSYIGWVIVDGKDNKKKRDEDKEISLLFSNPVLLNSTVKKNFEFLAKLQNKELVENEICDVMKKINLNVDLETKINKLTLAQKRKLAIARSILKKSKIVLIDDQFEGLSVEENQDMKNAIKSLFCNNLVVIALNDVNFKNNLRFFESEKFDKIIYLSNASAFVYKSINEFLSDNIDINVCKFCDKMKVVQGEIFLQDNEYYFVSDQIKIKINKKLYSKLGELKLENGDSEKVSLQLAKSGKVDFDEKNFSDNLIANKYFLFLNLDGTRII